PMPDRRRQNRVLMLKRKSTWRFGRQAIDRLPTDLRSKIELVELENRQTESEMVAAYQSADIFVATGFPEGFALPPLEAMACGAAVVGFTGGGGAEFMADGETALVASDGDADGLAAALERILRDDKLREELRQAGHDRAQAFGMDRLRDGVLAFADAVTGRG
ncbi:MAG: glycosyltransferase family 4 protein, partial [Hyphomicrobiales bacterium]|nr:glycosyltransferase family 4 protein [Hyphomicrobiales bacterium]